MVRQLIWTFCLVELLFAATAPSPDELEAIEFLNKTNERYKLNVTELKDCVVRLKSVQQYLINHIKVDILEESYPDPSHLERFSYESYENEDVKRQLQILKRRGLLVLPHKDYRDATSIINNFKGSRSDCRTCLRNYICDGPENVLSNLYLINRSYMSDDPDKMMRVWKLGRNATEGVIAIVKVKRFAKFFRRAAKLNGYKNTSDMWYEEYEEENFAQVLEDLIGQLRPLYIQLHAYVRHLLLGKYRKFMMNDGPIPQHLLGEIVYRTEMRNLDVNYLPYVQHNPVYFDKLLRMKNKRFKDNVNMADEYFKSMGLMELTQGYFRNHSRISKPNMTAHKICTSEYFDFDAEIGIRFCAKHDFTTLIKLHGDMTLIQYDQQRKPLPVGLNKQPCPGFAQGLADAISLSAMNFDYLRRIGMPEKYEFEKELQINLLFYLSVETLFPLMEDFVLEKLWSKILEKSIKPKEYNCHYWSLMKDYAGIEPCQYRSDVHFDPNLTFYDIFEGRPIAKIFSKIFGFQAYRALCDLVEPERHRVNMSSSCHFYGNKEVGDKLREIMSLGSKRTWRDLLEILTGTRAFNASALLDYFKPLEEWLIRENTKRNIQVGWESPLKCESVMDQFGEGDLDL